jgi:hypothetical protein
MLRFLRNRYYLTQGISTSSPPRNRGLTSYFDVIILQKGKLNNDEPLCRQRQIIIIKD